MKIPLSILALVALALGLAWWLRPATDTEGLMQRSDLPWQIETPGDGSSRVFGLHLGRTSLQQAVDTLGPYEELVIFEAGDGRRAMEAWFGDVRFGPLKAKVGVTLDAGQEELGQLAGRAVDRKGSPSGDWKLFLRPEDRQRQGQRPVSGVTYIPAYGGLEADFFRQRLGVPAARRILDAGAAQWFYPEKGLTLMLDPKGKEVLEYVAPSRFELPPQVEADPY